VFVEANFSKNVDKEEGVNWTAAAVGSIVHPWSKYVYCVNVAESGVWWVHITLLTREVTHLCSE